ncbi:MAG: hypothetical protein AVDCRST_MAG15-3392, partial [uncultured Rubellimicrobium sp.]
GSPGLDRCPHHAPGAPGRGLEHRARGARPPCGADGRGPAGEAPAGAAGEPGSASVLLHRSDAGRVRRDAGL